MALQQAHTSITDILTQRSLLLITEQPQMSSFSTCVSMPELLLTSADPLGFSYMIYIIHVNTKAALPGVCTPVRPVRIQGNSLEDDELEPKNKQEDTVLA